MITTIDSTPATDVNRSMRALLDRQKAIQIQSGPPSAAIRRDRLSRTIALLLDHRTELLEAMDADFGARCRQMGLLTDIASAIGSLKHARTHVRAWMRPSRRNVSPAQLALLGARAEVHFQPKGVIGVMSPWNFPVQLICGALAGAFAAGNRVMVKPSEYTPETSALLARLFDLYFDEEEIAFILGGPETGAQFAALPFDHLIFTGATAIGRHVMRAAAENLTPVTLELGGKSPVVIGRSADMEKTAARVMAGKTMNAGQICLAPDYVLAPQERIDEFVMKAREALTAMYPTIKDNPHYTAIINQRHYERLLGLIEDARRKGARVIEINPADEDFSQQQHRRIPPTLILDATDDMAVMQEEIFGPILPILSYGEFMGSIAEVNARPRPLALYYFGADSAECEALLARTTSGGVTINDVIMHVAMEDLPFGGVGPSGMGAYHGRDGFEEFSHRKAVYRQTASEIIAMLRPPYGAAFKKQMEMQLKP